MSRRYIYFMSAQFDERQAIKIGLSWKPSLRVVDLRRQLRRDIQVLANIPVADLYEARILEKRLHEQFASSRVFGEWFSPVDDLTSLIDSVRHYSIGGTP